MTANFPPKRVADTPAASLRGLAQRAHRMLRLDGPEDREEVLALLDEIARARRGFERVASDELVNWFDRLEAQVAGLLDGCCDADDDHHRAGSATCHRVGVA